MRLFGKFALAITGLIAFVLGGSRVILQVAERRHLGHQWEQRQRETVKRFADVCREAHVSQNDLPAFEYIRGLTAEPNAVYALLATAKNEVRVHSDVTEMGRRLDDPVSARALAAEDVLLQSVIHPRLGAVVDAAAPVRYGDKTVGVCRIGYSQDAINREIDAVLAEGTRRWNWVTAWALGLGLSGALVLASLMVRPIRALEHGARLIGEGVLTHRLDLRRHDELGDLAREFNEMAAALAKLDEMKQSFVASVSHELRSPLTAIKSHIGLLSFENPEALSKDARESLQIMRLSTDRLERFVSDILDMAKIEAGMVSLTPRSTSVGELLEETVKLFEPHARQNRCRLRAETAAVPPVSADPDRLRQVFTNLVSNAMKYTPEGGEVVLSAVEREGFVECAVADTGAGIPPESLPKIFNKFEQAPNRPVRGKGTGLGLAIAKGIVEAHGGRIWAENRESGGAVFRFTLPLNAPGEPAA